MESDLHYSFATAAFKATVAHGGRGEIQWCRANQGRLPNVNFIDITILPQETSIGVHTHATSNAEIYIVISGWGRMLLDGEWFDVDAGHVMVNRPGGTHGLENKGDTELRLVVIEVATPDPCHD